MRLVLPILCILTFCIVCVGNSDAIMPLGFVLVMFTEDNSAPLAIRVLVVVPFLATLASLFVRHARARCILAIASVLTLTDLWVMAFVLFVIYPMPGNQIPNAVPIITSIPFVFIVIATIIHSIRTTLLKAPRQIVGPERGQPVL